MILYVPQQLGFISVAWLGKCRKEPNRVEEEAITFAGLDLKASIESKTTRMTDPGCDSFSRHWASRRAHSAWPIIARRHLRPEWSPRSQLRDRLREIPPETSRRHGQDLCDGKRTWGGKFRPVTGRKTSRRVGDVRDPPHLASLKTPVKFSG